MASKNGKETLIFEYSRDTAHYRVYTERGGINKLYRPLPTGPANQVPKVLTVEITPGKSNG